jgi:hypothetical protein
MPRDCVNSADNFCYICVEVTFARQRKTITAIVKRVYHLYFGCKIGDQHTSWVPPVCCRKCATNLSQWLNGKRHAMPFVVPVVWREPSNHASDCYFCMVPPVYGGITKKTKWTTVYPNIPSALRPVPHGEEFPFPKLRKNLPSIQKTKMKASRPRVLSRRCLLKHTSATVENPLTHPRHVSTIKCSFADGLWMYFVHTKFSENWPNVLEMERLYVHTAWWFHNPVSHLQEGKRIKSPLLIHKALAKLSKNSLLCRRLISFLEIECRTPSSFLITARQISTNALQKSLFSIDSGIVCKITNCTKYSHLYKELLAYKFQHTINVLAFMAAQKMSTRWRSWRHIMPR